MTLNVTVVSRRHIYQSADYRLLDWTSRRVFDFDTQKIALITHKTWTASVCFAGVGRTTTIDVASWLANQLDSIPDSAPFQSLLDRLCLAESWLSELPADRRRHSFSVGAFIGHQAVYALISNYERIGSAPLRTAEGALTVHLHYPTKPTVYLSGQTQAVIRAQRRQLCKHVAKSHDVPTLFRLLSQINRSAARASQFVSATCNVTHVSADGTAHSLLCHNVGDVLPRKSIDLAQALQYSPVMAQFGPHRFGIRQTATIRLPATDAEHRALIRENPGDANLWNNYGAYLADSVKDLEAAELVYQKALDIAPEHPLALSNLAVLRCRQSRCDEARELYARASALAPADPTIAANYARLAATILKDDSFAISLLSPAIASHDSGALRLQRAELLLRMSRPNEALADVLAARDQGADEAITETLYAYTIHLLGYPTGVCIAAYETALALSPNAYALHLNLAQLLFQVDDYANAQHHLRIARSLHLDAPSKLELHFYNIAYRLHRFDEELGQIEVLLESGARLNWSVEATIAHVNLTDVSLANALATLSNAMREDDWKRPFCKIRETINAISGL